MTNNLQGTDGQKPSSSFPVVGIGASAGGLEAALALFGALPSDTGMAFVLVQHLDPSHESSLPEILSRGSTIPAVSAENGQTIERNCLYIIPPNTMLTIHDGALRLHSREQNSHPHYPIDQFFGSLAEDQGSRAIGVILSGTASDGAQGLRAIKCAGGTTFSQDEQSAQYGGMPHSAIATGAIDFILPPRAIAQELVRISAHPYLNAPLQEPSEPAKNDLQKIVAMLRKVSTVDFGQYKQTAVLRRVERRMLVGDCEALSEYVAYLERNPAELTALCRDLLVSVSSFFSDPEIFTSLTHAAAKLLEKRPSEMPFRIWCAGCGTGEEAYSLAIVIKEAMDALNLSTPFQLFATDVSELSVNSARTGDYPEWIRGNVSPERLQRFFTSTESGYRLSKTIRSSCIFARHDLIKDPPFSQLDLVSCRNFLINLNTSAQQRVLTAFHYGLKPDGILVLGAGEDVGPCSDLFIPAGDDQGIFLRAPGSSRFTIAKPNSKGFEPAAVPADANPQKKEGPPEPSLAQIESYANRILRDLYAPPGVTINEANEIVHFHGRTGPFLEPHAGEASLNLLTLAHQSILFALRKALDAATNGKHPTEESTAMLERDGETRQITVRVVPVLQNGASYRLVLFEDGSATPPVPASQTQKLEPTVAELKLTQARRELEETREYLRNIVEQHEVAIEELRAANEEVQSSNEEMRSTNEELRTAKEEVQSSNEELRTVNEELQNRNDELSSSNNDLRNVLSAVGIPIVMVDMDFRIRRYTPAAARLLQTLPSDLGRSIIDVHYALGVPALHAMLAEATETLAVQQTKIQNREGRWFSVQVRPYRTVDDHIDGAVITFFDIDDVTRALEQAEAARDFAEGIVETVQHPMLVLDHEFRIKRATTGFYKDFQVTPDETLGHPIFTIGNGQWNFPQLRSSLEEALNRDVSFRDLNIEWDFSNIGRRTMRLNAKRISGRNGSTHTLLLAIEDVTERKEAAEIQYRRLFESARDGIIVIDAATGLTLDANPYFLELTRSSRQEIVGRQFWEIDPFRGADEGRRLLAETNAQGYTQYDTVRMQARDGRQLIAAVIANRYQVRERPFIQVNIRDVTDRRRAEDELRRSNLDLQQFAFAASHDLQEPLRTVVNQVQLLQKEYAGKLGGNADEIIQFITSATDRMRQMILDLLSYSQVAQADLRVSPINIEAILATALSNLQLAIANTDARITFDPLPVVWMDQSQGVQLLQNLIGNALKYKSEERPQIHLFARQAGNEWVVGVQDNGLGIDPKYHQHIFAVFKRLQGRNYPGTGIGLATCQRIVQRHGGRIWVESELGKGSTFYFTVPINPKDPSYVR